MKHYLLKLLLAGWGMLAAQDDPVYLYLYHHSLRPFGVTISNKHCDYNRYYANYKLYNDLGENLVNYEIKSDCINPNSDPFMGEVTVWTNGTNALINKYPNGRQVLKSPWRSIGYERRMAFQTPNFHNHQISEKLFADSLVTISDYKNLGNMSLNILSSFCQVNPINAAPRYVSVDSADCNLVLAFEAPAFMKNNFPSEQISWQYTQGYGNPWEEAGKGSILNFDRTQIHKGRLVVRCLIKELNWISDNYGVELTPLLKLNLNTDYVIERPNCAFSQNNGDTTKSNAVLRFTNKRINTFFRVFIDNNSSPEITYGDSISVPLGQHILAIREKLLDNSNSCPHEDTIYIHPAPFITVTDTLTQAIACHGGLGGFRLRLRAQTAKALVSVEGLIQQELDTGKVYDLTLPAGKHQLRIEDHKGCVYDRPPTVTLRDPEKLLVSHTLVQPKCYGDSGLVQLMASGGTPPYSYRFYTNFIDSSHKRIAAGSRLAPLLRDARGCLAVIDSLKLDSPKAFSLEQLWQRDCHCAGDSTGSVATVVRGGDTGEHYAFSSDNLHFDSTAVFKKLWAGRHLLLTRNSQGCRATLGVEVRQPPALSIHMLGSKPVVCKGNSDGQLRLATQGGRGTTSLWLVDTLGHLSSSASTSETVFDSLSAGTYNAYVSDDSACWSSLTLKVRALSDLQNKIIIHKPSCHETRDGSIGAITKGGRGAPQYLWSVDGDTLGHEPKLSALSRGQYVLLTRDSLCARRDTVTLEAPEALSVWLTGHPVICEGQTLTLDAGLDLPEYLWSSDNGFWATTRSVTLDKAGSYLLNVKDSLGCKGEARFDLKKTDRSFNAAFLVGSQSIVGDTVQVVLNCPLSEQLSWLWTVKGTGVKGLGKGNEPIEKYMFDREGTYTIQLKATDGECQSTMERTIEVLPTSERYNLEKFLKIHSLPIRTAEVSPNPNTGRFEVHIELSNVQDIELSLHSAVTGHLIRKLDDRDWHTYTRTFEEDLPAGVYLLYVKAGEQVLPLRVLVTED